MATNENGATSIGRTGGTTGTGDDRIEVRHADGRTERSGGMRDRLDRDGDGRLDKDDVRGRDTDHGTAHQGGGVRDRLDRDGDGRLDKDDVRGRDTDHGRGGYPPAYQRAGYDPRVGDDVEHRVSHKPAKTSAAAVFALVFGLAALLSVLTVILSPLGLVLGIIGIVLGIVGMKMAGRVGVTGKGVAIGGLVLSILAVLLAAVLAAGVTTFLNDEGAVDRLEQRIENLRDDLPQDVEVPESVTP
ncbi:DUF4190 domain-containing protein [Vallicoccus soli]|uniref:DUF4190 domain-containing protein n=1 Tax=Vallicoccus soli TaxID=2339232 RepID=UPI0015AAC15C|nr:DUF4190 domain-containing protein [Vallicoccus soli]